MSSLPFTRDDERPAAERRLARLSDDARRARAFASAARAENTKRGYRADWRDFTEWCESRGLRALPAAPETVALYVSSRADALKVSTLQRRLSAISQAHKATGHDSPASTRDEPLHSVWSGLVRSKSRRKKKAGALLVEDLRAILAALPRTAPSFRHPEGELTLRSKRDRALLLVGWAGALRRSELAAVTVEDLQFGPEGLLVRLPRSKTDQEGEGQVVGLPGGDHPLTCPVRAVPSWLQSAGIDAGPVFRAIDRWDNIAETALSTDGVHRIIKRACGRVGLDPSLYSGHSLRAGFITQAVRVGKQERIVMRHSRHQDIKTFREYVREGGVFRENAARGVGL